MEKHLVWLVLAFPLLGVLLNGLLSHALPAGWRRRFVSVVGVGVVFLAFAAAL
ncbi:MAG: hypothetical protein HY320_11535, partial [Armatimonadetes bacterium]|nr:hypothetical protein [Armatimonadota bacterium]